MPLNDVAQFISFAAAGLTPSDIFTALILIAILIGLVVIQQISSFAVSARFRHIIIGAALAYVCYQATTFSFAVKSFGKTCDTACVATLNRTTLDLCRDKLEREFLGNVLWEGGGDTGLFGVRNVFEILTYTPGSSTLTLETDHMWAQPLRQTQAARHHASCTLNVGRKQVESVNYYVLDPLGE